jgi:adenylate kinase family enzyme
MSPQRVVVAGIGGAGKTTFAREASRVLGLPFTELDEFVEGPGWTVLEDFADRTEAFVAGDCWITDSLLYPTVEALLLQRTDLVVWLDLPRDVIIRRLVLRTLRRGLPPRPVMVNGNREKLWAALRKSSPLRRAWRQHAEHRAHLERALQGVPVVRLRSEAEARAWLESQTPRA